MTNTEFLATAAELRAVIDQVRRNLDDASRNATRAMELVRQLNEEVGLVR